MTPHPRRSDLPSHEQLLLPLLLELRRAGGKLTPPEAAEALARRFRLPQQAAERKADRPGHADNKFRHRVRWVRQTAVVRGFISKERRGLWTLSERGKRHLENCREGIAVTIYETERGIALWATAQMAAKIIERGTVQLVLTSPPYPLTRSKQYGNLRGEEYLEWLYGLAADWRELLVEDGSLVLNLADCWQPGQPTLSLYQERLLVRLVDELGYRLAQRFVWHNPCKPPASDFVTVQKARVKNTLEYFYWLGRGSRPYADALQVLQPHSERQRRLIAAGGQPTSRHPGGHGGRAAAFARDNGGSLPTNLLVATNCASNDRYCRYCRESGLPIHPARFPDDAPEFFIRLLTRPDDLVYDPFGGSGRVAEACERLDRAWVSSERSLAYVQGSRARIEGRLTADFLQAYPAGPGPAKKAKRTRPPPQKGF